MYLIYCYTNKENGKKYIGITSRSIEEREASHIYESKNKSNKCYNAPFKRAIRKYGIEGFDREIIDSVNSLEEACELEKYYIKKYNTYYKYKNSNGYNATIGGELIQSPKDRVIQIDLDTLEYTIWDSVSEAESQLKISIYDAVNKYNKSANNSVWIREKIFSIENYKEEIYINQNFICQVSFERELIHIWRNSKTAAKRLKLSQGNISMCCNGYRTKTGNYYWCFYKDYINNNYPIHKIVKHEKPVVKFDMQGNIIEVYQSLTEASEICNIDMSSISSACTIGRSAGGFLWKRLCEYNDTDEIVYINNNKTKVDKLNENKEYICSYNSVTEAADDVGVKYTGICRAIKNGCRSGGFFWRKAV